MFRILAAFLLTAGLSASALVPERFSIDINGTRIEGYQKHDGDDSKPWKQEGFFYQSTGDGTDAFKVTAWSSKGRAGQILELAEDQLLDYLQQNTSEDSAPVGYATSDRKEKHPVRKTRKYPPKVNVLDSPEGVKGLKQLPTPSPTKVATPETPKTPSTGKPSGWPWWWWIILLLALIALVIALVRK